MIVRGIFILLLAVLGAGYLNMGLSQGGSGAIDNQDVYADVGTVTSHHLDAFVARDIDTIMGDYAENAVLMTPDGVYTGLESIRSRLQEAMQTGNQSEAPFTVTDTQIAGPVAFVQWNWAMADGSVLYGADTVIVSHGKIINQTVSFYMKDAPEADATDDSASDAVDTSATEN